MCVLDLKSMCRAKVPTGSWLGSFCTGDVCISASLPSPPGLLAGHSGTHTPWDPWPRAWRASAGRAWGREWSLHQHCSIPPPWGPRRGKADGTGQAGCTSPWGPQALLCLLRPTVCPSWCPSPTDSHSSCGHPSIQVAPCPLPTRDNPWPRFSLMTAFSSLVLGGKRAEGEAGLSQLLPRGPETGLRWHGGLLGLEVWMLLGVGWTTTAPWSLLPLKFRKQEDPPNWPYPGFCCKSAHICSPDPEDRPVGNGLWVPYWWCSVEFPWDLFLPCSEQITHQSMLPSPHKQTGRLRLWEAK